MKSSKKRFATSRAAALRTMLIAGLAGVLTACATPATHQAMTAQPTVSPAAAAGAGAAPTVNAKLKGMVHVAEVKGGSSTNPLWASKVDNTEFKKALEDSLAIAGHLAPAGATGSYNLTADLQKLDQPMIGLTFDVKSTVLYTLVGADGSKTYPVTATGTATAGDAFVGVVRLRIANERSIATNIKALLNQLQNF